jgi:hypothetical protein
MNIGSGEMVSINQLVRAVPLIAGKTLKLEHVPGPLGERSQARSQRKHDHRQRGTQLTPCDTVDEL